MNKIFRNTLMVMATGALVVSCADYNEISDFKADPDPTVVRLYTDLAPVKSYIDRVTYPNLTLGVQLKVADFNKQELAHAVAVTNFDNYAFGTTLMPASIVNPKGVMNFLSMKELLDHVQEIGGEVFGSALFANANQADDWMNLLTAPIEISVESEDLTAINFNEWAVGDYPKDKTPKGSASIVKYDDQNVLKVGTLSNVIIVDGFQVDPLAKYTIIFNAQCDKDATYSVTFSGTPIAGKGPNGKWTLKPGKWTKVKVEDAQSADGVTDGYFQIENTRSTPLYIKDIQVVYTPDNHRPQTDQELKDTITYAINTWCDGLMKINAGRIHSFDLIDEPLDTKSEDIEPGIYDLKHSDDSKKIFWQDILGNANYAPVVSKAAIASYTEFGGDPAQLKFFINETGLEDQKTYESLMYWINKWDANGAKIDGINAKLNLSYSEDAATQKANKDELDNLLDNLAKTGKLIRLSNFDIKYKDETGASVTAATITAEQRQQLADYYGYVIKEYMKKIPKEKQAGICKLNMVDTGDPVGLWSTDSDTKDWVRTATYKAFCDALSGK